MLAEYTRINDDDVDLAQTKVADLMMTSVMTTIMITTSVIMTSAMMNGTYNSESEFKLLNPSVCGLWSY